MSTEPGNQDKERIFAEALALTDPEARAAYLEHTCSNDEGLRREIESLLAASEAAAGFLDASAGSGDRTTLGTDAPGEPPDGEEPGKRIGRYLLIEQLGEGGFGTVWRAEQLEPLRRQVALKILKLGMDTRQVVARFELERQALALMDHPNIAQVFDAGATDTGRPFFVMELVRGVPITDFCDHHFLKPAERMKLFVQVCQAVEHAHQKGIIHRDLKPSNILVTLLEGTPLPKVIDFGIAKATQGDLTGHTLSTHLTQVLGTPAYMSPEQARRDAANLDGRSDVYSLGILLYELLVGMTPFDKRHLVRAGLEEVMRIIREVDPPKPSTRLGTVDSDQLSELAARRGITPERLGRVLSGELDWIVMKALEKERGRRYASPAALAEDLCRHLSHRPVLAAPPSLTYRARRFLRRHRTACSTVSIAALVVVGGLTVNAWNLRRAERYALDAAAQRVVATNQTRRAVQAEERFREIKHSLGIKETQALLQEVAELMSSRSSAHDPGLALARVAAALRRDPDNFALTWALVYALTAYEYPRPVLERSFDGTVLDVLVDGTNALVAVRMTPSDRVQVHDLQTGRVQYGPLGGGRGVQNFQFLSDGEHFAARLRRAGELPDAVLVGRVSTGTLLGPALPVSEGAGSVDVILDSSAQRVALIEQLEVSPPFGAVGAPPPMEFSVILTVFDAKRGNALGRSPPLTSRRFSSGLHFAFDSAGTGIVCRGAYLTTNDLQNSSPILWDIGRNEFKSPPAVELARPTPDFSLGLIDEKRERFPVAFATNSYFSRARRDNVTRQVVAYAEGGRRVRWWDLSHSAGESRLAEQPLPTRLLQEPISVEVDQAGRHCLAVYRNALLVWELNSGRLVGRLENRISIPASRTRPPPRLSPNGLTVLTTTETAVEFWSVTTGAVAGWSPQAVGGDVRLQDAAFHPDGHHVLLWAEDGWIGLLELGRQELVWARESSGGSIIDAVFSRQGDVIAALTTGRAVQLYRSADGQPLGKPLPHTATLLAANFSPDGARLAVVQIDGIVRVWNRLTGIETGPALKSEGRVSHAVFTADGHGLLTFASKNAGLDLWDSATGQRRAQLLPPGQGRAAALAAERTLLAGSGPNQTLQFWDTTAAARVGEIPNTPDTGPVALTPSGDVLVLLGNPPNPTAIVDLPRVEGSVPGWLLDLAEAAAGRRFTEQETVESLSFAAVAQRYHRLEAIKGDTTYDRWLRWFLAKGPDKPLSPFTSMTWRDYGRESIQSRNQSGIIKALEQNPVDLRLQEARLRLRTEEALQMCNNSIDPFATNLLYQWPDLLREASQLLRQNASNAVALRSKVLCLAKLDLGNEAQALAAQVSWTPGSAYDHVLQAAVSEAMGDLRGAENALITALAESERDNAPAHLPMPGFGYRNEFWQALLSFSRRHPPPTPAVRQALRLDLASSTIPARDVNLPAELLDLGPHYSGPLVTPFSPDLPIEDLGELGPGVRTLRGISFDIRGVLARPASGIRVGRLAQRLHFLHGARYAGNLPPTVKQPPTARWVVRYADAHQEVVPITVGQDVLDWIGYPSQPVEPQGAELAWIGGNAVTRQGDPLLYSQGTIRVWKTTWSNPRPQVQIETLDLEMSERETGRYLVTAITADNGDLQPVVPEDAFVSARVAAATGRNQAHALEALDAALESRTPNREIREARAALLAGTGRLEEALNELSLALDQLPGGTARPGSLKSSLLSERSRLLTELGRDAEAHADAMRAKGVPDRSLQTPPNLLDLSPWFNAALGEPWHGFGAGTGLTTLPAGVRQHGGISFDVRGIVQLRAANQLATRYPTEVSNLVVGRMCRCLHALHATGWTAPAGTRIAFVCLRYADGAIARLPIAYGEHVRDWVTDSDPSEDCPQSNVGWRGRNAAGMYVRLFRSTWKNPRPDQLVESIDYVSTLSDPAPFLVALTVE